MSGLERGTQALGLDRRRRNNKCGSMAKHNPDESKDELVIRRGSGKEEESTERERAGLMLKDEGSKKEKRRKKKVMLRVGKEFVDCIAGCPLLPPFQPYPSLDSQFNEIQESYAAKERAIREEHERIVKQYEDHGYAEVPIEVTDDDDEA